MALANQTCDRNISLTFIDKIYKDSKINVDEFIKIISKLENSNSFVIDYLINNVPSLGLGIGPNPHPQ